MVKIFSVSCIRIRYASFKVINISDLVPWLHVSYLEEDILA